MLDIHKEFKKIVIDNGTSINKIINKMRASGYKVPRANNLSKSFTSGAIKFQLVQEILDFLGYKITIEKK